MPALARMNEANQRRIHGKSCNCKLLNLRTGIISPAYEDVLVRPYIDTNLDMHDMLEVFMLDNWEEGDFFTMTYDSDPGFVSSKRRVKFIQHREDGVPIMRLVIQGTIDRTRKQ
jgi:hypothetical protein